MTTTTSPARRLIAILCLVVLGLAGCSGQGSDDAGAGGSEASADLEAADELVAASEADSDARGIASREAPRPAAQTRAIISKGSVSALSEDVGESRDEVVAIATGAGGEVADERSESDDEGEMSASSLVLRIPSPEFGGVMTNLRGVGQNVVTSTNTEDVTTRVIDTAVRIRAQERSIRRIQVLLDRAQSIRDIVRVEGELTRRQSALESLQSQRTYLADLTGLGTIQVKIERGDEDPQPVEEDNGFLAGLAAGWSGLKTFTLGVLTVLGAVLPFGVVLLVLGLPTWLLVRRLVVRRPVAAPAGETAGADLDLE